MNGQKGSIAIILGVIVLVVIIAAGVIYYVLSSGMLNSFKTSPAKVTSQGQSTVPTQNAPSQVYVPPINSDKDLGSVSSTLDSTDLNQFDSALNQNSNDLSSF